MCTTCGCADAQDVRYTVPGAHAHGPDGHAHDHDHAHPHDHDHAHPHDHDHAHPHDHDHAHPHDHDHARKHDHSHPHPLAADPRAAVHAGMHGRTIALEQEILGKNQVLAERNRGWFEGREVLALNLMSSPGSGKTSLLERTIRALRDEMRIYVVEGDQATTNDAERIRATGCAVVQVNTGTGCHLEADMLARGLQHLKPLPGSLVLIENVGNLVCPALFDLGERAKVVVLSVTEGEDKPTKYPHMFRACRLMVINKIDLLPHVRFDIDRCIAYAREVNPDIEVLRVSAETGEGIETWYQWLRGALAGQQAVPDATTIEAADHSS
jgi:hydrogenase nickel incorporation protein HypB